MRKRLAEWLLARMASEYIQELIKKELRIVQDVVDFEDMTEERKRFMLLKAHDLHKNEFFQLLLDNTKAEQTKEVMSGADNQLQLFVGRANLLLADVLRGEVKKYNQKYVDINNVEEMTEAEKHSIT